MAKTKEKERTGGRAIQRARLAQLDALGEDDVFRLYLEHGSTTAMCRELFDPHPEHPEAKAPGRDELYRWLHADPERWARWQKVRELRGHIEADRVLEEAELTDSTNASAQRVRIDAFKWRAGVLNRQDFGPPSHTTQVNVGVQVGMAWLQALNAVDGG
jgi:hypothetical protein